MKLWVDGTDLIVEQCPPDDVDTLTRMAKEIEPSSFSMFSFGTLKLYFSTVEAAQMLHGKIYKSFSFFVNGMSIAVEPVSTTGKYIASYQNVTFTAGDSSTALAGLMIALSVEEARENSAYWLCQRTGEMYVQVTGLNEHEPPYAICRISREQYGKIVSR